MAATPQISERWLIPVLEQLRWNSFPARDSGFPFRQRQRTGSSTYWVAGMLEKLLIEQTKSRAHRTGDNGLVESKNGAVVRKHLGFRPHRCRACRRPWISSIATILNPYINFHRPCVQYRKSWRSPTESGAASTRAGPPRSEIFTQASRLRKLSAAAGGQYGLTAAPTGIQCKPDTEAAIAMQRAKQKLVRKTESAAPDGADLSIAEQGKGASNAGPSPCTPRPLKPENLFP